MTALFASVAGRRVYRATLRLPWSGVWAFDADLDEAGAELAGRVEVRFGGLVLSGTVDPANSGPWAEGRHVRVYGGANGWGSVLTPKAFHNDNGVRRSEVLRVTALQAGETIALDAAVEAFVGNDFVREAGAASAVFEAVVPGAVWWVDASGVTQVAATRPTVELAPGADLELVDYDPSNKIAVLAGDFTAVQIGTILRPAWSQGRLSAPVLVRELVYTLAEDEIRIAAHETSNEPGGRLLGPLVRIARRVRDERLPGVYRYRVVSMKEDGRVVLQAVNKGRWPDVVPCSLGAGIAGGWASLALSSEVLVAFEDEDRVRPFVISYTPKGRPGHVPVIAALNGEEVQLGGGGNGVVRKADLGDGGTWTAASNVLTYTGEDGKSWTITAAMVGGAVSFTVAPVDSTSPGKVITKAVGCSSIVKAG